MWHPSLFARHRTPLPQLSTGPMHTPSHRVGRPVVALREGQQQVRRSQMQDLVRPSQMQNQLLRRSQMQNQLARRSQMPNQLAQRDQMHGHDGLEGPCPKPQPLKTSG